MLLVSGATACCCELLAFAGEAAANRSGRAHREWSVPRRLLVSCRRSLARLLANRSGRSKAGELMAPAAEAARRAPAVGLWTNTELDADAAKDLDIQVDALLQIGVLDDNWASIGSELVRVVRTRLATDGGLLIEFKHLGASDAYFEWYACAEAADGGRPRKTLFHVCSSAAKECDATRVRWGGAPRGWNLEHINMLRPITVGEGRDLLKTWGVENWEAMIPEPASEEQQPGRGAAAAGDSVVMRRPAAADPGAADEEGSEEGEEDQPGSGLEDSGDDGSPSLESQTKRARSLEAQVDEAALGRAAARAERRPLRPAPRTREAPADAGKAPTEAEWETRRETRDPRPRLPALREGAKESGRGRGRSVERSRSPLRGRGRDPLDEAVRGLEAASGADARTAELLQTRGGGLPVGGADIRYETGVKGAQALLAGRAAGKVNPGRPRERAARTFEKELVERLVRGGRGGGGRDVSNDGSGDEGAESDFEAESSKEAKVKHDHFISLAARRPGYLLRSGLEQLRKQFVAGGPAGDLPPCCRSFLDTVFLLEHPPKSLGNEETRMLRTLATILDLGLGGSTVQALDVVMQEFKARTTAIVDGNWHVAKWMTLVPTEPNPSVASRDEQVTARRVAHAELRREELREKLLDKKRRF